MFTDVLINGLVAGGTYALIAMGLSLQYGIARIMNLAYGDIIITACFAAFVLFSVFDLNPIVGMLIVVPGGFVLGMIIYALIMRPLVARAPNSDALEVDSILATFGLLFVVQGVLLVIFGGNYTGYNYLNEPVNLFGTIVAANRLLALILALVLGIALIFILQKNDGALCYAPLPLRRNRRRWWVSISTKPRAQRLPSAVRSQPLGVL